MVIMQAMGGRGARDLSVPPPPLVAPTRVVVVTGSNTGLGFELIKQLIYNENSFIAVLTARDIPSVQTALSTLDPHNVYSDRLAAYQLEVTSEESVQRLASDLRSQFGQIDVVVNNAGVNPEGWDFGPKSSFPLNVAQLVMDINFFGAVRVTNALLPLMKAGGHVVNVGSKLGKFHQIPGDQLRTELSSNSLSSNAVYQIAQRYMDSVQSGSYQREGWPQHNYITSKALLHSYTRALAREQAGRIRVNALCPGWTRTNLGGGFASQGVEAGVRTHLMMVKSTDSATGEFFEEGRLSSFN